MKTTINVKKIVLVSAFVVGLMATLGSANQSLGWWQDNAPRSTHQFWDLDFLTPAPENPSTHFSYEDNGEYNVKAWTDDIINDQGAIAWIRGDVAPASFMPLEGENYVDVMLQIGNYPEPLDHKEIWIDVAYNGEFTPLNATGYGSNYPYTTTPLPLTTYIGDDSFLHAYFGFRIYPNPSGEQILFRISGNDALLHSIHADTICVPVPGAILLGGIGVALVGWLRKRRTLS